jgi:hypothetical protein
LLGHIDHAATAFANLLEQFVTADAVAWFFGERRTGRQAACRLWLGGGLLRLQPELEQARQAVTPWRLSGQFGAAARAFA